VNTHRVPSGPQEPYPPSRDLLVWLSEQFDRHGDIYKASIYGTNVYVVSDPDGVEHVLLKNWRNYVKGRAIKRIALLLGKGNHGERRGFLDQPAKDDSAGFPARRRGRIDRNDYRLQ
jgi:hypothetical protein